MNDRRIRIIIGHYGSGKTEFSVNYALKLAEMGFKVALSDLDIVNPYFRSREKAAFLEGKGIRVISSSLGHNFSLDLPAISSEIVGPIQDPDSQVILDVGGNSVGAKVLAKFYEEIIDKEYDMLCVVNTNRAETQTVEGIMYHVRAIEAVSQLKVTGLINNTHLLRETTLETVLEAQEIIKEASQKLSIPIKYISTIESVAKMLPEGLEGEIFPITMYMRDVWM
ncbi:MAG: ATP-binding protein [delta proteobacterium ML8_F1]|nr:MAG: ATP-binding protein [delta proteobacterium ML8_F1]